MDSQGIFRQIFSLESRIGLGVLVAVCAIVLFAVIRFRARSGGEPSKRSKANVLEMSYALALLGFAVFLIVDTSSANARETQPSSAAVANALDVNVLAYQWSWQFTYPDQRITVAGKAIGQRPTLVVPAGRPIDIALSSKDVVHEFWVPDLKYKEEAFPDHVNDFTIEVASPGRWIGRCSVYCGQFHYQMEFWLQAVTPAQFDTWSSTHHGTTV